MNQKDLTDGLLPAEGSGSYRAITLPDRITGPTPSYNAAVRAVPMPLRIQQLPISAAGFPVPWFVAWLDGVPDFRVIGRNRVTEAVRRRCCWVCGQQLGGYLAMTLGPMCTVNRIISEPPSHRDCAVFSALACPFLANPRMRRRENDLPEDRTEPPGIMLRRNPGAVAVWVTRVVSTVPGHGGRLFTFGDPISVEWFAQGRLATRAEVEASIDSGMPLLQAQAESQGPEAVLALAKGAVAARRYLPAEAAA